MGANKTDVLNELLKYAKQIPEQERCVESAAADTDLKVCPDDSRALTNISNKPTDKYGLTFPTDVRSLGTIENAAQWIVDNKERG